mgnify:CR=1 FL=1
MILRCQTDPYLRRLDTEVVSVDAHGDGFRLVLKDTILFPEGGGQPADHGTVDGQSAQVSRSDGVVVHDVERAVPVGPVRVEVDWGRRYDHMQQHTAQHLITAVAMDRHGWPTTSFHLGRDLCSIDLDVDGVGDVALAELGDAVNTEIRARRRVAVRLVEADQMDGLGVRTRGLPDGHVGQVRLIEIEDLDLNTCGGTHVANTSELECVYLLGTERVRGGQTRLNYLAGVRVRARLQLALAREATLAQALSTGPENHAAVVGKLQSDLRAADKDRRDMRAELARFLGAQLAQTQDRFAHLHRPGGDMAFLNNIGAAVARLAPDLPVFLTAAQGDGGEGVFLLLGPAEFVRKAGAPVASFLGGRGGGPPGRFQGKVAAIEELDAALDLLRQIQGAA